MRICNMFCRKLASFLRRFPARVVETMRSIRRKVKKFIRNITSRREKKKFVGITFTSRRNLGIHDIEIDAKLLDSILKSGINIRKVETLVLNNCRLNITSKQFCDFLKKLKLTSLEFKDSTISEKFVTDEMILVANDNVTIDSKKVVARSPTAHLSKKFVGIILNSLKSLEIYSDIINENFLKEIEERGFNLKLIETLEVRKCQFKVTTDEFCEFLKTLELKSFVVTDCIFRDNFVTDEMIRLAKEKVVIRSKKLVDCVTLTSDLIHGWIQNPEKLINQLELRNIIPGFKLEDILAAMKALSARPKIKVNWVLGTHYNSKNKKEDKAFFPKSIKQNWSISISDDSGLGRMYELVRIKDYFDESLEDCKITFWIKEENN